MTTIELFMDQGLWCGFAAYDHSGFAREGEDIVCAAVSAITQTALLGLTDGLLIDVLVEMSEARLLVNLPKAVDRKKRRDAHVIIDTMRLGLTSIALDHAEWVNIKEQRI